jgi:hypothetical protein
MKENQMLHLLGYSGQQSEKNETATDCATGLLRLSSPWCPDHGLIMATENTVTGTLGSCGRKQKSHQGRGIVEPLFFFSCAGY